MYALSEGFLCHYVIKVFPCYLAAVACCPLQHLLELLDAHSLSQLLRHTLYIIHIYRSSFVIVEKIENFVDSSLNNNKCTLDYLSPSFEVIASRNSSKSISRPSPSSSAIIWKIVGFLDSKPRLCMADLSYLDHL